MSILKELGLVGNIPVNIERLIKGQGIKLNTNAKPEDFTPNKKVLNTINKEILQQVLLEIVDIMSREAWVKEMHAPIDKNKTEKQIFRSIRTRTNEVYRKYGAIKDLIKQI